MDIHFRRFNELAVKRALIVVIMLTIAAAAGCTPPEFEVIKPEVVETPERGFFMGVLPMPAEGQTFENVYSEASRHSEIVPVWGRPTPFYNLASDLSGSWGKTFVDGYIRQNGLVPLISMSFIDRGLTLAVPPGMDGASLSSKDWRDSYIDAAVEAVKVAKPQFLSAGNEVNRWYEKYGGGTEDPNGFGHFTSLYEKVYDAVKEVSPDTVVFCTFSREIVSENREADLAAVEMFKPHKMDMLVFTSYPHSVRGINRPGDIPEDYYSRAAACMPGKPFGFSEIAWPSADEFGGERAQAEFLYIASTPLTRSRGLRLEMLMWPWLTDLDSNDFTGLLKRDGTKKPAFRVWKNLYRSRGVNGIRLRETSIPGHKVKMGPESDCFPPILNCGGWETPVPVPGEVNTPGGEDSPFITNDGKDLYFFFTPDTDVPVEKQVIDGVTGTWMVSRIDDGWTKPQRVVLHDDVAMDGCTYINGDVMWFASVRAGNYGEIDIYTAKLVDGRWTDVRNAGEQLNKEYDLGEFHITADGREMYCGGPQKWENFEGKDIYVLKKTEDGWSPPEALPAPVNTKKYNEDQPFISTDGTQLWFTGQSRLGHPGPAVFMSERMPDGSWGEPVEVISRFAGEPTLDDEGNIYFVHHFFTRDMKMIEADIYVAYKKAE